MAEDSVTEIEDSVTEIEEISAKGRPRTSALERSALESPRLALGRTSPAYFDSVESVDTPKNDEVMQPSICKLVCV